MFNGVGKVLYLCWENNRIKFGLGFYSPSLLPNIELASLLDTQQDKIGLKCCNRSFCTHSTLLNFELVSDKFGLFVGKQQDKIGLR